MLYSPILDRQALLLLLQMNSVLGSVGNDAALSRPHCAEYAGLVHFHLGSDSLHGVVPDPVSETC